MRSLTSISVVVRMQFITSGSEANSDSESSGSSEMGARASERRGGPIWDSTGAEDRTRDNAVAEEYVVGALIREVRSASRFVSDLRVEALVKRRVRCFVDELWTAGDDGDPDNIEVRNRLGSIGIDGGGILRLSDNACILDGEPAGRVSSTEESPSSTSTIFRLLPLFLPCFCSLNAGGSQERSRSIVRNSSTVRLLLSVSLNSSRRLPIVDSVTLTM